MEEKINLSLFEDFFEFSSPADYAKTLINIKNADENIGIVAEAKDRISDLKDRVKEMKQKKNKNSDETLKIIKKILDYNKDAQKFFQEVGKGKSKLKLEESIAERVKLRKQKLDIIKKKKENINNELFSHYFDYLNPVIMFERLRDSSDEKNKDLVKSINMKLAKLKNIVKNVPKYKVSKVEENQKIVDIAERILDLNSKKQSGRGLKVLTPNQMVNRLPISLAQLKSGNNSDKLKNEIR